ncbi:MAG TPA: RNB domain-containing ribonuclease, partial [Gammaproteobacteria bacterium]|nr:RNB domain-containing ribonuclease [Gammaproteobacteria bacterium]
AHRIIEECMLAANVSAAKYLLKHKHPTLFRVHDKPPEEKLAALRAFLSELSLDLKGGAKPTAMDYSILLRHIEGRDDAHLIQTVMLRSMSQAVYSPTNLGHFGLSFPAYLHFTSPIRRYPDLIVHRGIKRILQNESLKEPEEEVAEKYEALGHHFSSTERRADDATRDATLALKCEYMADKVGEIFEGIVSAVTSFGLFVELKNIYIEGLIHISQLGEDYFYFEPIHHRVVGERTRQVYQLGDHLTVKLVRVDVDDKKIDFELFTTDRKPKKSKPKRRR